MIFSFLSTFIEISANPSFLFLILTWIIVLIIDYSSLLFFYHFFMTDLSFYLSSLGLLLIF